MEAERTDSLEFGPAKEIVSHDGTSMKSESPPTLAYFNGRVWMAYRCPESRVHVACRIGIVPGVKNLVYQNYDLHNNFGGQGRSSEAPSITEFNGRLYVFWKAGVGNKPGDIVYTSTEDGEEWAELEVTPFKTAHAPAVCHHKDHIYLVFLTQNNEIMLSSFLDGKNQPSPAKYLRAQGNQANITTQYTPLLIDEGGLRLVMYWGAAKNHGDQVFHADLDTASIYAATGTFVNPLTVPHELDNGKWQTKVGNTGVYGKQNTWIITTTKDGHISIAFNNDFETRANLTTQSGAKSHTVCGACLVPGYYSHKYGETWGIVLVYRGYASSDSKLYEVSILRETSQADAVVADLTDQLAQTQKDKAAAEAERDKYKAEKDALQTKVGQLEKDKAAAEAERDRLKTENQQLRDRIAILEKQSGSKEEVDQLRGLLVDLRGHCQDGSTCVQARINIYNTSIGAGKYPGQTPL